MEIIPPSTARLLPFSRLRRAKHNILLTLPPAAGGHRASSFELELSFAPEIRSRSADAAKCSSSSIVVSTCQTASCETARFVAGRRPAGCTRCLSYLCPRTAAPPLDGARPAQWVLLQRLRPWCCGTSSSDRAAAWRKRLGLPHSAAKESAWDGRWAGRAVQPAGAASAGVRRSGRTHTTLALSASPH